MTQRRLIIALLVVLAALAIRWRLTSGSAAALGARAERDAAQGSVEKTLQAEHEAATGTGRLDYNIVRRLVQTCHEAVREKLQRYRFVELDEGVALDTAYIYTFVYRDLRYVGVMKEAPTPLSNDAERYPALMPPLDGSYIVDGYAAFGMSPIGGGSQYDNRSYHCTVTVLDQRIKVKSVTLTVVK